jgi:hypothetical protein
MGTPCVANSVGRSNFAGMCECKPNISLKAVNR